jgi:hypothetical protein
LNWMGESMVGRAWDGVVLEGADLTRAVLCGASLRGARLRGARLEKALLNDADLSGADLAAVDFAELAPLREQSEVPGIAWHPTMFGEMHTGSARGRTKQLPQPEQCKRVHCLSPPPPSPHLTPSHLV